MTEERACDICGAPLPLDAPVGALCATCTQAQAARPEVAPTVRAFSSDPAAISIGTRSTAAGQLLGDFEVIDILGRGGMGTVYRARQLSLDRLVALKVLPNQFEDDPAFVGRFQREATIAASLNHPNLIRVFASGVSEGSHFIAMELITGEDLRQRLRRTGPFLPVEALRTALSVARGLQCGWQKAQLVHRDIKPSNIYLAADGQVKLGDLGLAKSLLSNTTGITNSGAPIGTPHYISPEQARGDRSIDFRADIYSLGCTLYELLTGSTPYAGNDPLTIMNMHLTAPPPAILKVLPTCPIPLGRLVSRMLRKSRHERFQTYEELIAAFESALEQIVHPDAGPSAIVTAWKAIGQAERGFLPAAHVSLPGETAPLPVAPAPNQQPGHAGQTHVRTGSLPPHWIGIGTAVIIVGGLLSLLMLPAPRPPARIHPATPVAEPIAAASPTPVRLHAERIWTAADKIPHLPGVSWDDNAVRLDGRALAYLGATLRDAAIRARIRMNPDAAEIRMKLRFTPEQGAKYYTLNVSTPQESVAVSCGSRVIAEWPLPRHYEPDEWALIEFRAYGDRVSVTVEGQTIGSARDEEADHSGSAVISAKANGFFRDIFYIPLEQR